MKKIKEAYAAGKEGRELESDASRRSRLAHSLGRLTRSKQEMANPQPEITEAQYLDMAAQAATHPNKIALVIIKWSMALRNGDSDPIQHTMSEDSGTHSWSVGFHAGERKDGNLIDLTPLFKLPPLMINRELIPVDNVTIDSETTIEEGQAVPPATTLTINSRPADPENAFAVSADTLRIHIQGDGTMRFERGNPEAERPAEIDSMHPTVMGFLSEDLGSYQQIDVEESNIIGFLDGVSVSVKQTSKAFTNIHELGEKGLS